MNYARPALLAWSSRYGNLREVTRDDALAVLRELHGHCRSNVLWHCGHRACLADGGFGGAVSRDGRRCRR
jgi:hypothetical protein